MMRSTLGQALLPGFVRKRRGAGWARRLVHAQLARLTRDQLVIHEAGQEWRHGAATAPQLTATVTVHDPAFYTQLLLGGDLGAADGFIEGSWSTDDLPTVFRVLVRNESALAGLDGGLARAGRALARRLHRGRSNSQRGSKRNIRDHYDLGNVFFESFLDETLTYSCALFESSEATLEQASIAKLDRLCRKLDLQATDHLLEIGTGWGSMALHAAREYGCRVTTTTISDEQYHRACERVAAAGLSDRVQVWQRDYRDLEGTYDKIVSVEMLEAVGKDYLGDFFAACYRHLKDDGMVALQVITTPDHRWGAYRRSVDFIQHHVFPGSCCPSLGALVSAMANHSRLRILQLEDLTPHYRKTLARWRERFHAQRPAIRELGASDSFLRLWDYYLSYCEAGFAERHVANLQLVLGAPGCRAEDHLLLAPRTSQPSPERARGHA